MKGEKFKLINQHATIALEAFDQGKIGTVKEALQEIYRLTGGERWHDSNEIPAFLQRQAE